MEWDFTPEEVVKGEVAYDLVAFRNDLFEEIAANLGREDEGFLQASFDLIYDLCYWEATGREFAEFIAGVDERAPLEPHILHVIREHMQENITMLGAILQRMIMDGVESGMVLDQAVASAAERHRQAVAQSG